MALGVNVMIVVVAFMKGFQHKFREDIIDAQGHARAIPLKRTKEWRILQNELTYAKGLLGHSLFTGAFTCAEKGLSLRATYDWYRSFKRRTCTST